MTYLHILRIPLPTYPHLSTPFSRTILCQPQNIEVHVILPAPSKTKAKALGSSFQVHSVKILLLVQDMKWNHSGRTYTRPFLSISSNILYYADLTKRHHHYPLLQIFDCLLIPINLRSLKIQNLKTFMSVPVDCTPTCIY